MQGPVEGMLVGLGRSTHAIAWSIDSGLDDVVTDGVKDPSLRTSWIDPMALNHGSVLDGLAAYKIVSGQHGHMLRQA